MLLYRLRLSLSAARDAFLKVWRATGSESLPDWSDVEAVPHVPFVVGENAVHVLPSGVVDLLLDKSAGLARFPVATSVSPLVVLRAWDKDGALHESAYNTAREAKEVWSQLNGSNVQRAEYHHDGKLLTVIGGNP